MGGSHRGGGRVRADSAPSGSFGLDGPTVEMRPQRSPVLLPWLVAAAVAVVVVVVAVVLAVSRPSGTAGSPAGVQAAATTPLGCPAPVPAVPVIGTSPQLECTERALIGRVCDLDPDSLAREEPGGLPANYIERYRGPGLDVAMFVYQPVLGHDPGDIPYQISLACTVPPGDYDRRPGQVTLHEADWRRLAAPGTVLPAVLTPQASSPPAPYPVDTAPPVDPATAATCSARAVDVFTRLAHGATSLDRARAELPSDVPPSALTNGLDGVGRYEADGIPREDAITEAAGAVAQSCEY